MNKLKLHVSSRPASQFKARVYFFVEDETVVDNMMKRRSRPYKEYRKMLPTVLSMAGCSNPEEVAESARWSQKAGCSCGCSPGFILNGRAVRNRDFYVSIK